MFCFGRPLNSEIQDIGFQGHPWRIWTPCTYLKKKQFLIINIIDETVCLGILNFNDGSQSQELFVYEEGHRILSGDEK